jgi:preprotein translocase subunit YajC
MFISNAYAQTAAAGSTQSTLMSIVPLLLMFAVLYFIMIRPQMKRQKETKAMLDALQKGDEVATAGGILGKITSINESMIDLQIASNVTIQVQRHAVVQVLPKGTVQ